MEKTLERHIDELGKHTVASPTELSKANEALKLEIDQRDRVFCESRTFMRV